MRAEPMPETKQKPQGSFGIPEKMMSPKKEEAKESAPAPETVDSVVQDEISKQRAEAYKVIKKIEEKLGITIDKTDIIDFVRKGRIVKKEVQVIPGVLTAAFQTLTGDEVQDVQKRVFTANQLLDTTSAGVENESAFWNLAYGLASYQGKDMNEIMDKSKVKTMITKLGAHVLDKLSSAYVDFNYIVRFKLNDAEFLKK